MAAQAHQKQVAYCVELMRHLLHYPVRGGIYDVANTKWHLCEMTSRFLTESF